MSIIPTILFIRIVSNIRHILDRKGWYRRCRCDDQDLDVIESAIWRERFWVHCAMAKLRNLRHEIFAVELAADKPPLRAYLAAGYKPTPTARFNAFRLRNTPEIRARVVELLEAVAKTRHAGRTMPPRYSAGEMS